MNHKITLKLIFVKITLFIFILCLCNDLYAAIPSPIASIILSEPVVSKNLTHFTVTDPNSEPYTVQSTKDGVQCRQIPDKKYAYFNVSDAIIPLTQNNLIFYITFYDEGTSTINLQYNANDGVNYKSNAITKTNTNAWITVTVAVTNASFRNAQNNASDFRINGNGNNYIKEIAIAIGTLIEENEPIPTVSSSSYSEFIGKSVVGYQAWFKTGNATSGWNHWSGSAPPAPNKLSFEIYPDVTEYLDTDLAQTSLANLGNGNPSKLFNSTNKTVIDTHFKWMKDYGIDGAAVQRFIGGIGGAILNSPNSAAIKIKQAAEANGRLFYICYDISSTGMEATWDDIIKFDWVYNVEQNNNLTASPAYAKVGNKPVVQLWGPGFTGKHPGTAAETIALIRFLKSRGCYVIGGTPTYWRTNTRDAKGPSQALLADQESFEKVYPEYDMISPWMPGRFKDLAGADNQVSTMAADKSLCDGLKIKYLPVIFPGFAWSQWNAGLVNSAPRNGGEFMWRQALNIKKTGFNAMYFAMFDEYDEGTGIMKNATDWTMIPTDQYFLTSSADGIWCSSDFQLRVAQATIEMLKGKKAATIKVPVPYSLGPVYYRNSFEKRTTAYNYVSGVAQNTGTFNIDPCFYKSAIVTNSPNIINPLCDIQLENVRSGLYSVKVNGTVNSNNPAVYSNQIAELKIPITNNQRISFWKKTESDLGRYVFVDLITKSGKKLSSLGFTDQNGVNMNASVAHGTRGAGWEQFTCEFGKGMLLGDTLVGLVINYEHIGTGSYTAYFDDFLITEAPSLNLITQNEPSENLIVVYPNPSNGQFTIKNNFNGEYIISLYNESGKMLLNRKFKKMNEIIDLKGYSDGIYIVKIVDESRTYVQKLIKH